MNENMTPAEIEAFEKVRSLLTEDFIPKKYKDRKIDHKMYGHCYHATLAMYDLLGGKEKGYKIKCATDNEGTKHYWLEKNGRIIDPTFEQYSETSRTPPYDKKGRCDYRKSNAVKQLLRIIKEEKA